VDNTPGHTDDATIAAANGKRVRSHRAPRAADAVGRYFKEHPEAGPAPYFEHRMGIVAAVVKVLTADADEKKG
jgi:hypothetical protein